MLQSDVHMDTCWCAHVCFFGLLLLMLMLMLLQLPQLAVAPFSNIHDMGQLGDTTWSRSGRRRSRCPGRRAVREQRAPSRHHPPDSCHQGAPRSVTMKQAATPW